MGALCSAICGEPEQAAPKTRSQPANNNNNAAGGYPAAGAKQQQQQQAPPATKSSGVAPGAAYQPTFGGQKEWPASSRAGDGKRAEASQHAQKRGELLSQSQAAFQRGDKALAKQLSEQGKASGRLMEQCNAAAAELYFADNNRKHDQFTIDLHGLYVDEAVAKVEARISACQRAHQDYLVVIVGRGNHSKDHVQKLKPALERMVAEHRLRVIVDAPNTGCFTIMFNSSEGQGIVRPPGQAASQQSAGQCLQQ